MSINWLKKWSNLKGLLVTRFRRSTPQSSQGVGNLNVKVLKKSNVSPAKSPVRKVQNKFLRFHGARGLNNIIGIIIHYISAVNVHPTDPYNLQKIINIFNKYKVSADYLIDRQGKIYKLVPSGRYAYHAGLSKMPTGEGLPTRSGNTSVNKITVGIELMGTHSSGYTSEQMESCAWLCNGLVTLHPVIDKAHIVGHQHVSPGRKIDPGPKFDWNHLYSLLN